MCMFSAHVCRGRGFHLLLLGLSGSNADLAHLHVRAVAAAPPRRNHFQHPGGGPTVCFLPFELQHQQIPDVLLRHQQEGMRPICRDFLLPAQHREERTVLIFDAAIPGSASAGHAEAVLSRRVFRLLQFELQVFGLSFGSIQGDGEQGLHLRVFHFTGEVDLQLIVIHWAREREKQISTPSMCQNHPAVQQSNTGL